MSARLGEGLAERTFYDNVDVTGSVIARGVSGRIPDDSLPMRKEVSLGVTSGDDQFSP